MVHVRNKCIKIWLVQFNYVLVKITFLIATDTKEGQNYVVPAVMHHYKFNFKLPEHAIPSSYEGVCGAVRYWLKLAIHRSSLLHAEKARYKPITVLDYIDVNAAAFRVSLNLQVTKRNVKILSAEVICFMKMLTPNTNFVIQTNSVDQG